MGWTRRLTSNGQNVVKGLMCHLQDESSKAPWLLSGCPPGITHSGEGSTTLSGHPFSPTGSSRGQGTGASCQPPESSRGLGQELCEGPSWNRVFQPQSNFQMTAGLADRLPMADGLSIASPQNLGQNPAQLSHPQILALGCCEIVNACCFFSCFRVFC